MNIERILCPIDFSDFSKSANEYAVMLAKSTGARIIYLHAYLPDPPHGSASDFDFTGREKELLAHMEAEYSSGQEGVETSWVVQFGMPAETIVDYAKDYDIDMIVLGTHGRTGFRRILMGSVAEAVVRQAECPVLAIKSKSSVLQENQ